MRKDSVACPACGKINRDLWDYHWDASESIEANCGSCGAPFMLFRYVDVTYQAIAICEDCHKKTDAGPCPGCRKIVCEVCAEREVSFCRCEPARGTEETGTNLGGLDGEMTCPKCQSVCVTSNPLGQVFTSCQCGESGDVVQRNIGGDIIWCKPGETLGHIADCPPKQSKREP